MRNITVTLPIYKFWELPKDSTYKASSELIKIFPPTPGEDFSTKFDREWKLRDWVRKGEMELLSKQQREYYEKAEFFADGELFVEGVTWMPKQAQIQQITSPASQAVRKVNNPLLRFLK